MMNAKGMVSRFKMAAIEVAEGLFTNVKAFATLVGKHPAITEIIGAVRSLAVIYSGKAPNDHGPATPHFFPGLALA